MSADRMQHPDWRIHYLADRPAAVATVAEWLFLEWQFEMGMTLAQSFVRVQSRLNRDRIPMALVAEVQQQVAGTCSIILDTEPGDHEPVGFLAAVFVQHAWRRRGIGTALCRRAVAEARRLGLASLHVYTPAQADFYARRGWRKQRDALIRWGARDHLVSFMDHPISGEASPSSPTGLTSPPASE